MTDNKTNLRRNALKKIIGGTAVSALTMAHRPALGAICVPSGHISAATHVSSLLRHGEPYSGGSGAGGCGGLSEGAWKNPYNGSSSSWDNKDGGPADWAKTSYRPNKPTDAEGIADWNSRFDPLATGLEPSNFDFVFTGSDGAETMEDVLHHTGNSLDRVAVEALLNAELYGWNGQDAVHPEDVIGLYEAVVLGDGTYTLLHGSGATVSFTSVDLYNFFKGLIH